MRVNRGLALIAGGAVVALAASACSSSGGSGGASAGGTFKIGVINETTGALGAIGQQEAQGMQLAVSQINAAGGIKGKKLALDAIDDQGSVNLSTAALKKLALQDKVSVIIGPGVSAPAYAIAPLADSYGVVDFPIVSQAVIANKTKNVFETPPPGTANAQAMVDYAKSQNAKTVTLIYANNPYGQEGLTDLSAAASKAGIKLIGSESWDPSKFDFTAQASKVKGENPNAVFLYGSGGASDGLLLKAVVNSGYQGKIIGDLTYSESTIPSAAGAAANRVVSLTAINYGSPSAAEKAFLTAFQAKFGALPSVLSAYAYVAVKMTAAALAKSPSSTGNDLAKTIQSLNYNSLIGAYAYQTGYHGGPGAAAFKPVTFHGKNYASPPGS